MARLFTGEYVYSVDAKGRAFFPSKFRDELGENFVIAKGLDQCLTVYPMDGWKALEEKINALPRSKSRDIKRFLFACAVEVAPDKQGRVLLPPTLREYAGLDKDVVFIGVSDTVEIWDNAVWEAKKQEISSDDIAALMDELGI